MSDPLDESQKIVVTEDELKIPSETEHKRLIVKLWIVCILTAGGVFAVFGGIVMTLFLSGYDSKKIVEVSTSVFQVLSMTAGVGFFIPLGLTSIITLLLGLRMSRRSINVLDKLDDAIESRLLRVDNLIGKAESTMVTFEAGKLPPGIMKLFEDAKTFVQHELGALKSEIKGARTAVESDLAATLDKAEAELEAEAGSQGDPELEANAPAETLPSEVPFTDDQLKALQDSPHKGPNDPYHDDSSL